MDNKTTAAKTSKLTILRRLRALGVIITDECPGRRYVWAIVPGCAERGYFHAADLLAELTA